MLINNNKECVSQCAFHLSATQQLTTYTTLSIENVQVSNCVKTFHKTRFLLGVRADVNGCGIYYTVNFNANGASLWAGCELVILKHFSCRVSSRQPAWFILIRLLLCCCLWSHMDTKTYFTKTVHVQQSALLQCLISSGSFRLVPKNCFTSVIAVKSLILILMTIQKNKSLKVMKTCLTFMVISLCWRIWLRRIKCC